jgi:Na+/melibiose symporter-like transporter
MLHPVQGPPLGRRHKLAYGVGQIAEGLKNGAFETFLLFYYNQALGLPGTLSGAALMIALIFDAVTDPLAGSLSDSTRSRFGRRHPWMVAAALPLGLAMFALFSPPAGLGTWGLFAWLTVGAISVRGARSATAWCAA